MNLSDYLQGTTHRDLAARVEVHPSLVSQWVTGRVRVTAEKAIAIETATNGAVTRSELRPDLWPRDSAA